MTSLFLLKVFLTAMLLTGSVSLMVSVISSYDYDNDAVKEVILWIFFGSMPIVFAAMILGDWVL